MGVHTGVGDNGVVLVLQVTKIELICGMWCVQYGMEKYDYCEISNKQTNNAKAMILTCKRSSN